MKILANPERRGIAGMLGVALLILAVMALMNGALEKWFNITWFSGPSMEGKCVYISERSGTAELYQQSLTDDNAEKITDGADAQSIPSVSPNGRRVIFVAAYSKSNSIFSIRGDGKDLVQVTQASGPKAYPSFSRDGKRAFYLASRKLYVADADGSSPKFILPTREEQAVAINDGQEMPSYKEYAWESEGDGVLAACGTSPDVDQLVYLPGRSREIAKIPLSGNPNERVMVTGICAVPGKASFVVAANVGPNALVIYVDPKNDESRAYVRLAKSEVGRPAVSQSGDSVVVPARNHSKKTIDALMMFPIAGGTPTILSNLHLENPVFVDKDKKILATQTDDNEIERNIVLVDVGSHEMKKLTTDGKSYNATYCPEAASK